MTDWQILLTSKASNKN